MRRRDGEISVEFFLTEDPIGVCEVTREYDSQSDVLTLRGYCPKAVGGRCIHVEAVAARFALNGYSYNVGLDSNVDRSRLPLALQDPWVHRELLIHHQQHIEVI